MWPNCFCSKQVGKAYLCFKPSELVQRLLGSILFLELTGHHSKYPIKEFYAPLLPIACSSA